MVGRRGENFEVKKRWKKYIYAGREDGIFVHPKNGLNGLIRNWCIGGCWFTPALPDAIVPVPCRGRAQKWGSNEISNIYPPNTNPDSAVVALKRSRMSRDLVSPYASFLASLLHHRFFRFTIIPL